MTVKELIDELQALDPDLPVITQVVVNDLKIFDDVDLVSEHSDVRMLDKNLLPKAVWLL